jgi:serine-type D-Ala-D-Ala carboxypeptidase (penicillin-binding protein 5/6)
VTVARGVLVTCAVFVVASWPSPVRAADPPTRDVALGPRPVVTTAVPGLRPVVTTAVPGLRPVVTTAVPGLRPVVTTAVPGLRPVVTTAVLGQQPAAPDAGPPPLGVRAAALIEESTGQQLYGENADAELPIASTTKLMTALVALHHASLDAVFTAPDYYAAPEDTQIYLRPGERMSVRDLLTAMMLPSADDAAEDVAYNVGGGSVGRFIAMMNARARELGLAHTHYATPIGLDTPGNYSSAGDLVALARVLLTTEPFIRGVVDEASAVLRTGSYVRYVTNLNDLVGRVPWINGVKTGHTLGAGYVLVASGTRGGMTLIGAVLGGSSRAACDSAALALLDYGFANFRLRTPVRAGQVLARPAVAGSQRTHVRLIAASAYSRVFPDSTRIRLRVKAPAQLTGPLPRHAAVGSVLVLAGRRVVARIALLLARRLDAPTPPTPAGALAVRRRLGPAGRLR